MTATNYIKTIKRFVAAQLFIIVAVPTQALGVTFGQIEKALYERGIRLMYSNVCEGHGDGATYNSQTKTICILELQTRNINTLSKSLLHEVVHAVQDCKAGWGNIHYEPISIPPDNDPEVAEKNMTKMWNNLEPSKRRLIMRDYPRDHWDVEIEAYFLSNHPETVYEMLLSCN